MYTIDDYDAYCQIAHKMKAHQTRLVQRACEVYFRIFNEYLNDCALGNERWYNARLYEACRERAGISQKCGRFTELAVSIDANGRVYMESTFSSPGDVDNLVYDFDAMFLWDEAALSGWIERSKRDYNDFVAKRDKDEAAAEEARERADYERLKAKYGN